MGTSIGLDPLASRAAVGGFDPPLPETGPGPCGDAGVGACWIRAGSTHLHAVPHGYPHL